VRKHITVEDALRVPALGRCDYGNIRKRLQAAVVHKRQVAAGRCAHRQIQLNRSGHIQVLFHFD
jgi:hypothetical protein